MRKSDLKNLMSVITENCSKYFVIGDVLVNADENIPLSDYNEDFSHKRYLYKDIKMVRDSIDCLDFNEICCAKILWERDIDWNEVSVDTPILIEGLMKGHFAGVDEDGYPTVFNDGRTSYTAKNRFPLSKDMKVEIVVR